MVAEYRVQHVSYENHGKGRQPKGISVRLKHVRKATNGWGETEVFSDLSYEDIPADCSLKRDIGNQCRPPLCYSHVDLADHMVLCNFAVHCNTQDKKGMPGLGMLMLCA